jgi:hypothetical protein
LTKSYLLRGPCNGNDAQPLVKIEGFPPQDGAVIRPWEDRSITIRGIEIAQASGPPLDWAMAGDDVTPDIMLMLGMGETHGRHDFPAATGMPFPAKADAKPGDYLDLHIVCDGRISIFGKKFQLPSKWERNSFSIFYTVYYTIP